MFIGQHICKIDGQGRIVLPKAYTEILAREAKDERALIFVPAVSLSIYTRAKGASFIEALKKAAHDDPVGRPAIRQIIYLTQKDGRVLYSKKGEVVIPPVFMKMYKFSYGMEITLCGFGDYIGLVHNPGRQEL